jgi:hypothetical protein
MAYTDTPNMPLHMPTPGTKEPASIALLNENCVVLSNHDHTNGKGLAMGRLRSGLAANRPAAGQAGNVYFSTDTGTFNADTGTAWVQFLTSGGQATVTGWTLIDPIIRDTLQFGPEGSGTIDASITRTAANSFQVNNLLGVRVAPGAWRTDLAAIQYGTTAAVMCDTAAGIANYLLSNVLWGTTRKAIVANTGAILQFDGTSGLLFLTAPSVAAGADQTFTTRTQIAPNGTLTLTPATGQPPLVMSMDAGGNSFKVQSAFTNQVWLQNDRSDGIFVANTGASGQYNWAFGAFAAGTVKMRLGNNGDLIVYPDSGTPGTGQGFKGGSNGLIVGPINPSGVGHLSLETGIGGGYAGNIYFTARGGTVSPSSDGANTLGGPSARWGQIYSTVASISTSHVSLKQDFAPLDSAACVGAVLETDWLSFEYKPTPPVLPDIPEDDPLRDDKIASYRTVYEEQLAANASARKQKGYVLGSEEYHTADLFGQDDRYSASTHADLAVVACALQDALRRLAALEASNGNAAAA